MPLYETIARDLLNAMDTGELPVGALVPTEHDLARRYGVSRQTVRAAMRRLAELGAVSRRPRAGTRVEPRAAPNAEFQQTLGALSDLLELAAVTRRDIVETRAVVMDRRMAHRLGCAAGSRWLCVSYIRRPLKPSARPMAWVDCYVDERYGPVLDDLASDPGLVSDRIAHQFGVVAVEVHQSVAARRLDAARAKALAAAAQSPALEVVRRYLDATGRLFEISHSIHPADRYAVTTVLKRVASRGSGGSAA